MNSSLKNKNARGQPSSYCQTILFKQAFLLQGQEAANQVCILLWKKETRREGEFLLRYCPHGCGRLLSSWANSTKNKTFSNFLNSGNYGAEKGKYLQLTNLTESSAEPLPHPPPPQFDWLACMTQRDRGGQKNTNRGFNKVVCSSVSQSEGPN